MFSRILLLSALPAGGVTACSAAAVTADSATTDGTAPDAAPAVDAALTTDATVGAVDASDAGRDAAPPPPPDAAVVTWCADGGPSINDADAGNCEVVVDLPCGIPTGIEPNGSGAAFAAYQCLSLCPSSLRSTLQSCELYTASFDASIHAEPVQILCGTCMGGRRPAGFEASARRGTGDDPVGAYFAQLAELEGASIAAFDALHDDLVRLGAPSELPSSARRAADDERRHTAATARIARRHGATPPRRPRAFASKERPLVDVALENAVEGCVRETFAALVARYQAAHATDVAIARAMARIAEDETRHAALSWAVARWTTGHLDEEGRARVDAARSQALADLERELSVDPPAALADRAGVPTSAVARALLSAFATELNAMA